MLQDNPAIARVYGAAIGVTIADVIAGTVRPIKPDCKSATPSFLWMARMSRTGDELVADIASRKPGTKVTLGFVRNGKKEESHRDRRRPRQAVCLAPRGR